MTEVAGGAEAAGARRRELVRIAAVFAACTATLLFRASARLTPATFWAEDANVFLSDALTLGPRALVEPYAGYIHLLPRVFGFAAALGPLRWVPLVDYLACLVFFAAVVSWFASDTFSSVVADPLARAVAGWLACFAPGLHEVLGNFSNIHSVAFLCLTLLFVARWQTTVRLSDLPLAFVLGATTGELVVLLPLMIAFAIVGLRNPSRRRHVWLAATLLLAVAWHGWAFLGWRHGNSPIDLMRAHHVTLPTLAQHYTTGPWLGVQARTLYGWGAPQFPYWIGWLSAVFAVAWGLKTKRLFFVCAMYAWAGVILVSTVVRPDNDDRFLGLWTDPQPIYRQDFLGAVGAIFLWVAVLRHRVAVLVFAICYLVGTHPFWRFEPYAQAGDWARQVETLERIRRGEEPGPVLIHITPDDFYFRYPPAARDD